MTYQELNGLTDWWNAGTEYISSAVSDAADWVSTGVSQSYDWVGAKASEMTQASQETLEQFQKDVEALIATQSQVDQVINSLPEGSALKVRLSAQRDESRGMFETYVLPAWKTFSEWAGFDSAANFSGNDSHLGFIPIGIAAVLGAVGVAGYYVSQSFNLEQQILNDPELKSKYLETRGVSLFSFGGAQKYAIIGAGLVGVFFAYKMVKDKVEL